MYRGILKLHRYLSLSVALLWLLQALTGTILVFHREIDALVLDAPRVARDFTALDAGLADLRREHPGWDMPFIYAADGFSNQLDVYLRDPAGHYEVFRMDGRGEVLRVLPSNPDELDAGMFEIALELHKSLLAGDAGHILVAVSAILLLTNIALGIRLAWPRAGQWRRALSLPKPGWNQRFTFALHRTLGLWMAVPAMVVVTAGALIVWDDYTAEWLGAVVTPPAVEPIADVAETTPITPAAAMARAMAQYPGARFSVLNMPRDDAPYYKVRLAQKGELRKVFGHTAVFVSARDGAILARHEPQRAAPYAAVASAFYPVHLGEAWGLPGRIMTFTVGLWLMAMITLGLILWWRRGRRKGKRTIMGESLNAS